MKNLFKKLFLYVGAMTACLFMYGSTYAAPDTSIIYVNASITGGDGLTAETAFAKIQSGINAVSTGGTVHVAAGTYVEKISVSKSLTLQGANKDTTIINATGLAAHPEHTVVNFNLTSGNILFDGFTVNNGNNFDSVHYMMTNVSSIITISNNIFIPHGNPSEGDYDFGIINTANSSGKIIISSNSFINNFYYDPIHFGNFLGESDVEYNTIQVPIDTAGITYVTESNKHSTLLQSIHNNTLTHPSNEYSVNAILIESAFHNSVGGRFENIEILNNTINNVGMTKRGIQVSNDCSAGNGSGGEIISPRIQGNTINGNGGTNSRGLQLIGYITNANISGNTFTNLQEGIRVWDGAYTPGKFAVGTQIHNNSIVDSTLYSVNWLGSNILDATGNWWGESVESAISSKLSGNITYIPYYINADKTLFNTEAVTGDTATATSESPQITLTDPEEAVTITIEDGVDNVTIDVSTFVSEGEGEIPAITINSPVADEMTVIIPATTIVSDDTGWNGLISAPTVTTVTLPETVGQTKTLVTAIEIGYSEATLSFDDAVRIIFPGQAGKRVGYLPHDGVFTEITDTCPGFDGSSLAANESCKKDVDGELEVWTRHFTIFALYTQTTTTTSNGGGGGGLSISKDTCPDGDTSPTYYDGLCVTPKIVVKKLGGEVEGVSSTSGDISNSPYSTELNSAYLFAFQNGLTTIKNVRAANLNGSLYRKDMAKMMTNYAIKVLGKTPNTGTVCSFNDISSQSTETLFYAKLSCQLGIMGLEANGTPAKKFNSSTIVTRAEFGTALSRMLYGNVNNHSSPSYYQDHLAALKSAGIIKNTQATLKETKGYAMLMLMRAAGK